MCRQRLIRMTDRQTWCRCSEWYGPGQFRMRRTLSNASLPVIVSQLVRENGLGSPGFFSHPARLSFASRVNALQSLVVHPSIWFQIDPQGTLVHQCGSTSAPYNSGRLVVLKLNSSFRPGSHSAISQSATINSSSELLAIASISP